MNREAFNKNSISTESCPSAVEARDGTSFFRQVFFGSFLERQKGTEAFSSQIQFNWNRNQVKSDEVKIRLQIFLLRMPDTF